MARDMAALGQTSTTYTWLGLFFGFLSFVFGVIAEKKKAPLGTPILGKDLVICNYPKDQTVILGAFSIVMLLICVASSHIAVFSRYKGNAVKSYLLFKCTKLKVFFTIAWVVSAVALVLTLWATVSQSSILRNNIHHDMATQCPTAKTGLIGGGGFMSLNAALMWYIVHMLSQNRKVDLFDEEYENHYDISLTSMGNPYLGH